MKRRHDTVWAAFLAAALLAVAAPCLAQHEGTFAGTWSASGTWDPVEFPPDREVFTFRLAGHVNLKTDLGVESDYWAEMIGLWDAATGGTARCVWRHPDGRGAAFCVLEGLLVEEGVRMTGEFVGGAGALAGLTGTVAFTWSSVQRDDEGKILTAYSEDLAGTYRLP